MRRRADLSSFTCNHWVMQKQTLPSYPLAHIVVGSPVGRLALVATKRGLANISYTPRDTVRDLRKDGLLPPSRSRDAHRNEGAERILEETAAQLEQYFAGHRHFFSLNLDLLPNLPLAERDNGGEGESGQPRPRPNPWVSAEGTFRVTAQVALLAVPYGETWSYGDLAAYIGNPGASRAVGTACATNPLPIVLPCHRITRSDGSMGNYTGGVDIKRTLLRLEQSAQ